MAPVTKSLNAIKTADEFLKVGDKVAAIQCLYDSLDLSKNKIWVPSTEDAINKLLDICIDIQESESAKEALSQYRNICQQHSPSSMTTVVDRFLDACKMKIEQAQKKYELNDSVNLCLEEEVSADSILSFFALEESNSKRVEREVIYPWVRFYWDNIRSILDLIKVNNTMEDLYHSVCKRAFDFCTTYNRVNEFATLRRTLHKHLEFLMNPVQDQTSNRFRVTWCPKTAEMQMNTRFNQLEAACSLKLWSEAFNVMTDIRVITSMTGCRVQLHAVYYQKLKDVFWEFHNYLYHAYAQIKLLAIHKKQKSISEEEMHVMSCQALLAALCIPTYSIADDETHPGFKMEREKEQSINSLFGVLTHISRDIVHSELASLEILSGLPAELSSLYTVLEKEFHPLDMIQRVQGSLEWVEQQESLKKYLPQLKKMVLLRVLKQMETVFSVMKLQNYNKLIEDLHFNRYEAERMIMEAGAVGELHIRIDYQKNCVYFKPHIAEKDVITSSINTLAKNLTNVMLNHNPANTVILDCEEEMIELVDQARFVKETMHDSMIERFKMIEEKKVLRERAERDRNLSEAERLKRESEEREEREKARLREEEERRFKEQEERERKAKEEQNRQEYLTLLRGMLGKKLDNELVSQMDIIELRRYVETTKVKVEEERKQRVQKDSEKQLFLARAYRENSLANLKSFFQKNHEGAVSYWTESFNALYAKKKDLIAKNAELKPLCDRLKPYVDTYATNVLTRRAVTVQEAVEQRFAVAEEKRKAEEARRAEEERKRREEEERRRKEEEERRAEEERKKREEEERKRREEEELRRVEEARKAEEARRSEERRLRMMQDDSDEEKPMRKTPRRAGPRAAPGAGPAEPAPGRTAPRPAPVRAAPEEKKEDSDDGWTTVERKPRRVAPKRF